MMNAAAGSIGGSKLQLAQPAADPTAPDATGGEGDFTSALAAACTDKPDSDSDSDPETADPTTDPAGDAQAAAMLALAGLVKLDSKPVEPPGPATDQTEAADDALLAAGIVAEQAVARATTESAMPGADAAVAPQAIAADEVAASRSLVQMRAQDAAASRGPAPAAEIAAAVAGSADVAAAATEDSGVARRFIGELLDRVSSHVRTADPDTEVHSTTGTALYANTRETVAVATGNAGNADVVRSPVGSLRWANELGSRMVLMSMRGQQEGSLSLVPEHLGPVEVRINVSQDSTNVWFGAQHADTRAALTDALPRLRELFAASGLALGQAGVSHDMPRQEARRNDFAATSGAASVAATDSQPAAMVRRVNSALLDAWA